MATIHPVKNIVRFIGICCLSAGLAPASATSSNWRLGVEAGPVWQSRNDVQIPGDTGTRFSLTDLAGDGPFPYVRLELAYQISDKHSLRFLLAPLAHAETGLLQTDVSFAGQSFSAGQATDVRYQFNSYRATYRYRFFSNASW